MRLVLTKRAQRDSKNIQLYTLRHWGHEQAVVYEAAFDEAYARLRENPEIGRERPEYGSGLRSLLVEHHLVYYRIKGDLIEVTRILHERMDHTRRLR